MRDAGQDRESLGYHLHRAFAALTAALNAELRALGLELNHAQFSVLRAVGRQPGLSQNELARETGKDSAAISRSLDHLEKRGLIHRERINGCTKGVFLTHEAEALEPLLEAAIHTTVARACANMDSAEVEMTIALLEKIVCALGGPENNAGAAGRHPSQRRA